jgi:hypothetical protein
VLRTGPAPDDTTNPAGDKHARGREFKGNPTDRLRIKGVAAGLGRPWHFRPRGKPGRANVRTSKPRKATRMAVVTPERSRPE